MAQNLNKKHRSADRFTKLGNIKIKDSQFYPLRDSTALFNGDEMSKLFEILETDGYILIRGVLDKSEVP